MSIKYPKLICSNRAIVLYKRYFIKFKDLIIFNLDKLRFASKKQTSKINTLNILKTSFSF